MQFCLTSIASADLTQRLTSLSGVVVSGKWITASTNVAWLVEETLKSEKDANGRPLRFQGLVPKTKSSREVFSPLLSPRCVESMTQYQKDILKYASSRNGITIWAPCGTGKTLAGIAASVQGLTSGQGGGNIVWVTRSASRYGHAREIGSWLKVKDEYGSPRVTVNVIEGQTEQKFTAMPGVNFWILSWEILPFHVENLIRDLKLSGSSASSVVVFDEIHKAKNASRFKAIPDEETGKLTFKLKDNISGSAYLLSRHCQRRIGLTATALKDRVKDLYAQLDLIEPGEWGTREQWMTRYADRHRNIYGGIDDRGYSNLEELNKRLSLSVINIPASVARAQLPPLRRAFVTVPESIQSNLNQRLEARETAGLGEFEAKLAVAAARKKDTVFELIKERLEASDNVNVVRLTVFVGRRSVATRWATDLRASKLDINVEVVTGDLTGSERDKVLQRYVNASKSTVLICTADSMGEAIDGLQCSDAAYFAFLPYTPGQLEQWEGRFDRIGMRPGMIITYLIAENSVDEKVSQLLLSKLPAVEKLAGKDHSDLRLRIYGDKSDSEIEKELLTMLGLG